MSHQAADLPDGDTLRWLVRMAVEGMKRENPHVQRAQKEMNALGRSSEFIDDEIARVFMACLWELKQGLPLRFEATLEALGRGISSVELFPDELYVDPQSPNPRQ